MLHSKIFCGSIQHRRFIPIIHKFKYPICMLYINLAETNYIFKNSKLWSYNKSNLASIQEKDYCFYPNLSLTDGIRKFLNENSSNPPAGDIHLLTQPRMFGLSFNPLSIYYCFHKGESTIPACAILQVQNTPWNNKHAYIIPFNDLQHHDFNKTFHVSPLLPMDMQYSICMNNPSNKLTCFIKSTKSKQKAFDATLNLSATSWSNKNLNKILYKYALQTHRVYARIYRQAFMLWIKGAKFYSYPDKGNLQ